MPVQHDATLKVHLDRAGQHAGFDVTTHGNKIVGRHGMDHAFGLLFDDRALVQIGGHIMGSGPDELHPSFMGLVIGLGALKRGQEIALEAPEGSLFVRGNSSFIAVALRNLIENALQYSPAGEAVTVKVERPGKISVLDRGCGIEKSRLGLVFDRFWRADRKVEDGAGLGLSIVQQIMVGHGGQVEAAQNPGGGALFTLIFPEFSAASSIRETAPSAP